MQLSSATAATVVLCMLSHLLTVAPVQLVRNVPTPVGDNSMMYRHNAYVDQKVRQNAFIFLNHQEWHQRNVITSPFAPHSFASNVSAPSSTQPPTFTSPSLSFDTSAPVSAQSSPLTSFSKLRLPSNLGTTESLVTVDVATWDNNTSAACSSALSAMNGVASNPSGMAACYNVRDLNSVTGSFQADLRLYRIAAPIHDWAQLKADGVNVGMSYASATVNLKTTGKAKRDALRMLRPAMRRIPTREIPTRDISPGLSNGVPPKLFEALAFIGKVSDSVTRELKNETAAYSILAPKIGLSGTKQDGTPINTVLSLDDASFVSGLFTNQARTQSGSRNSTPVPILDMHEWLLLANTFAVFPVGLIITSTWALMLFATVGYGGLERFRSRKLYRSGIKCGSNGGPERPQMNEGLS